MARILIVEDSRTQAAELRFVLESAGFKVEHAASAEDALAVFDPGQVDLVISDIVMPGMTGYALCRHLKARQAGPGVPVMLLSSLSDPMDIVSGLECGADNFLTKPYDPDVLLDRVRTVLGNQAVRRSSQGEEGIDIMFLGRRFQIRSSKEQILDLLLSTFEDVVHTNRKLQESQAALSAAKQQLERHAEELEQQVRIRTRKLEDQRRHLAEAQAIARLGNWRLPCHSETLQWSDELYRIFQLDKHDGQITLARVLSMIHPEDRGRIELALKECSQTGISHREEFRILRSDGEVRYCLAEIRSEIGADGTRSALFGVCQDVTSLKLAEITANENAERYLGLVEALPDSVLVVSHDEIVFANRPAVRLLGAGDPADLINRKLSELEPFQQKMIEKLQDALQHTGGLREIKFEGPDGSSIEVEITSSLVDYNRTKAVQLIIRDVTERNALTRQMQQTMRMDAIGQLTGGVAHDFNNLLAVVMGNAELLRELLTDGSEEAELTDEVLNAAGRGADLVRRLLAFARKQQLQPKAVQLNERLPDILALLRRTLGEHIHIRTIPDPDLGMVHVDAAQVDDAILNLAINARDAMPGGGTLTIRTQNITLDGVSSDNDGELGPGDYVLLEVGDTGTGMSPDVAARALEPFFTTKASGRGTGLGLSQVYGLVKQSGGHLKINSELGRGTMIKIYLPRIKSLDAADGKARVDAQDLPTGAETILVVEDKPDIRQMVVRQLKELGYAILEAQDASHALDVLGRADGVDLLFTDVLMPGGMTGIELARIAQERRPEIRVLFTSGYAETALEMDGHTGTNSPLLSKPYRKHQLARAVRSVLDGSGDRVANV